MHINAMCSTGNEVNRKKCNVMMKKAMKMVLRARRLYVRFTVLKICANVMYRLVGI